jgi:hypothetical protein
MARCAEYRSKNIEKRREQCRRSQKKNEGTKKDHYVKNKEHIRSKHRQYYEEHAEAIKKKTKEWQLNNKERRAATRRAYQAERERTDLNYKIKKLLRTRLYHSIKGESRKGSAVSDLGCTIEQLKTYIESKFAPGMGWSNWSTNGWHLDHVRPLSSFDLTDQEQLKKACHYTNLQPLWASDNLKKSNKWTQM